MWTRSRSCRYRLVLLSLLVVPTLLAACGEENCDCGATGCPDVAVAAPDTGGAPPADVGPEGCTPAGCARVGPPGGDRGLLRGRRRRRRTLRVPARAVVGAEQNLRRIYASAGV